MGFTIGVIIIINNEKIFCYTYILEYDKYIDAISNLEEVEKVVITEPKYRRCCIVSLEILKSILQGFKNVKEVK